jgi:hypothetical protein
MCGRFQASSSPAEIARWFKTTGPAPNMRQRYNAAPTQGLPVVLRDAESGARRPEALRWGLVRFWAKDAKIAYSTINAMAETVATKPAFRDAFKSRRCLVPADGFYEWKKLDARRSSPIAWPGRPLFELRDVHHRMNFPNRAGLGIGRPHCTNCVRTIEEQRPDDGNRNGWIDLGKAIHEFCRARQQRQELAANTQECVVVYPVRRQSADLNSEELPLPNVG